MVCNPVPGGSQLYDAEEWKNNKDNKERTQKLLNRRVEINRKGKRRK